MNDQRSFERLFADRMDAQRGGAQLPNAFYDEFQAQVSHVRQRPRWLALIKEPPMRISSHLAVGSPTVRVAAIMVATLLLALMVAGAGIAGSRLLAADGGIVVRSAAHPTCEFGQGSEMSFCEFVDGTFIAVTFSNPQGLSGAFDGIATVDGTLLVNQGQGTFQSTGTGFFAGEVEGCGTGTVQFDYASSGTTNPDGSIMSDHDTYTIVPGGTLAVAGSYERSDTEAPNGDGTATATYVATYTCDEAPAADDNDG